MRILVTGIDGFVGSHTARFLLTLPRSEVHGTVIDPSNIPNIKSIKTKLHLHKMDILDGKKLSSLFKKVKPDRVIHLAGQAFVPTAFDDPVSTFQVNIIGGINVIEAARTLQAFSGTCPSLLIVSTGEVYGKVDRLPITEDFPLNPNNPYAASKASIDIIAQQYRSAFNLPIVVVRPFNHAGPGQSPIFVCSDFGKQFAEIALGKRKPALNVGNTKSERDFTDVRDVVKAYWMLLEQNPPEVVFNVCSAVPTSVDKVLSIFQDIAGFKVEITSEQRRLRSYDVPIVVGSHQRLRKTTGWFPTIPIENTLRDVYDHWKQQLA